MVQAGGMRCGGEKVRQKMSGGKAERSGRNDDGQEKACDKAGRNACCRIKAKGADRGEKRNDGTRRRGKRSVLAFSNSFATSVFNFKISSHFFDNSSLSYNSFALGKSVSITLSTFSDFV